MDQKTLFPVSFSLFLHSAVICEMIVVVVVVVVQVPVVLVSKKLA